MDIQRVDENCVEGKHVHLRKVRTDFYIFAVSVFVTFGSFVAMNSLQSSINIEDGLGNKAAMSTFGSGIFFAVFAVPVLLRFLRPKLLLIFSDTCFLVYVALNAYPAIYTLIPAGIFAGMASATTWPCTSLFTLHFGLQHWIYSSRTSTDIFAQSYTAKFFGIFQLNQVFGNTFTTITFSTATPANGENTTDLTELDLSVCGANDCQDPNVTRENIDRYNPPSNLSFYLCIGLLSLFIVMSIIAKLIFLPTIPSSIDVPQKPKGNYTNENTEGYHENLSCEEHGNTSSIGERRMAENSGEEEVQEGTVHFVKRTLKATLSLLFSPQQLLVGALSFYDGMVMSFAASELTRAYASCVLGLPKVGAGMICYGIGDIIFSFMVAKTPTSGWMRNLPMVIAFLLDAINYSFCLTWDPEKENSWVIYLFFFGFGCADGLWQTILNYRYSEYFPDKQDIAFTLWNLWIMLGFFMQYALSSLMCVYEKIYLHIALLVTGVTLYAIAEVRYLKKASTTSTQSDDPSHDMQNTEQISYL